MRDLLVFGRTGQVARELARLAPEARFLGRDQADLSDPQACADAVGGAQAVINSAAYTAVDQAESDPELAHRINADAPAAMAMACRARGIPFLHVSSDYVFSGEGSAARDEDAPTGPLNIYGASKLAGEDAVMETGGQSAILRTSWVFSRHGRNFLTTMLALGAQRDSLAIVDDQIGGPTPASDIAAALLRMAGVMRDDPTKTGIFHLSGAPDVSWAGFAASIFAQAGLACRVDPIPTSDYPTPARRPLNSRLDCHRIQQAFGIERPDWRQAVARILDRERQI
ncbi:dTDP-4-dehydrorhamnose reductase [Paracoccus sp. R86501]|uniref:dTDP-4-dehydrorhamnose reductase n=1 Tax=Paracoccus sp. R86501 TaxID=3101711 RepID=UPI00366F6599